MKKDVEKMYGRMPETVRDSEALSDNAKKVLAGLLYSYAVSKAKTTGVLYLSNAMLRNAVEMKTACMLGALRELEMHNLIERKTGRSRTEGQRSIASEYIIHFDALREPVKELSFDDIFGEAKPSETPMGTATTIAITTTTSTTIPTTTSTTIPTTTTTSIPTTEIVYNNIIKEEKTMEEPLKTEPTNLKELSDYIRNKAVNTSKDCKTIGELEEVKNLLVQELEDKYSNIPSYRNCLYSLNNYFQRRVEDLMVPELVNKIEITA